MAPSAVESAVPAAFSKPFRNIKKPVPPQASDSGSYSPLNSPLAWKGPLFSSEAAYTHVLTKAEISEIEQALYVFKELGLDGDEVNPSNFPLPSLAHSLRSLARELHQGIGFFVLRGLNPAEYSPEDNTLIFVAIAGHIGDKRGKQNENGDIFTHIREAKHMAGSQHDRPVRDSTLGLTFHTDTFCDILAMQTLGCGARGGRHIVSSSYTVFNELASTRPDLLQTLVKSNWSFDPRCPHHQSGQRSLVYYHGGHVIFHFVREPLTGFDKTCRFESTSVLSPEQLEALDAVEAIAQKHQLVLSMRPGDLTFVNNFGLLHSREAFEDDDVHSRYLCRMWLKNSKLAWKLPRALEHGNRIVFRDDREKETWNFLPTQRLSFKVVELFGP